MPITQTRTAISKHHNGSATSVKNKRLTQPSSKHGTKPLLRSPRKDGRGSSPTNSRNSAGGYTGSPSGRGQRLVATSPTGRLDSVPGSGDSLSELSTSALNTDSVHAKNAMAAAVASAVDRIGDAPQRQPCQTNEEDDASRDDLRDTTAAAAAAASCACHVTSDRSCGGDGDDQDVISPRPSYAAIVTKRLPRSRTGALRESGQCRVVHPSLFIDIPARTSTSCLISSPGAAAAGSGVVSPSSHSAGAVAHGTNDCLGDAAERRTLTCSTSAATPAATTTTATTASPRQSDTLSGPAPVTNVPPVRCARGPFGAVEVIPGLFLGANADAANPAVLHENSVSLVLNVAAECPISPAMSKNEYGVRYVHLPLKDHSDEAILPYFLPIAQIIHAQLHRRALFQQQQLQACDDDDVDDDDDCEAEVRRNGDEEEAAPERGGRSRNAPLNASTSEIANEEEARSDLVLLSASAVSGHPRQKETRHETPRSPTPLNVGSRASSCMVSPTSGGSVVRTTTTTTTQTGCHAQVNGPLSPSSSSPSSRRNRFAPTFPSTAEVSQCEARETQETAHVLRQLTNDEPATTTDRTPTRQSGPMSPHSHRAPRLSEQDCGGVLVHCRMGVSRSASFILAYLILFGKHIADLPSDGCAAQWLFREGWAQEESQLLASIFATVSSDMPTPVMTTINATPALTASATACASSTPTATATTMAGRFSRASSTSATSTTNPNSNNNNNNALRFTRYSQSNPSRDLLSTSASLTSPTISPRQWLPPMAPLSPNLKRQLMNRQRVVKGGPELSRWFASSGTFFSPLPPPGVSPTTASSPRGTSVMQDSATDDVEADIVGDGDDNDDDDNDGDGDHSPFHTTTMNTTLNDSSLASPLGIRTERLPPPREIAMFFCEPCYHMRFAAAPSLLPSPGVQNHGLCGLTTPPAAPQQQLRSPNARCAATPVTVRLPALDGAMGRSAPSSPNDGKPRLRLPQPSRDSPSASRRSTTNPTPVASPCIVVHTPPPPPTASPKTTTPTTTTTTTTVVTTSHMKARPQLIIEPFNIAKSNLSVTSPTSCTSPSLVSVVSAAPQRGSGLSYSEAFHFLKSKKSNVNPNIGFVLALREFSGGEEDFSFSSSLQDLHQ